MKNGVLKNFAKFKGKRLCQSLFFNKIAGLIFETFETARVKRGQFYKFLKIRPATLLKKRLWHSYYPVNFAKFLRTPFQNTSGRLLLTFQIMFLMLILP